MCGILGLASLRGGLTELEVAAGARSIRHRGPDDSGLCISPDRRAVLGHRRLSIVDLSTASHQPMMFAGRFVIVFNGEIYNFADLRLGLIREGAVFSSTGDTEVVLAAYIRWGERCVQRFNGMFAFAVFDLGDQEHSASLFFARDRAGEKPFFYRLAADRRFQLCLGTEGLDHPGRIDLQGLNHYLALGDDRVISVCLMVSASFRRHIAAGSTAYW